MARQWRIFFKEEIEEKNTGEERVCMGVGWCG